MLSLVPRLPHGHRSIASVVTRCYQAAMIPRWEPRCAICQSGPRRLVLFQPEMR